MNESEKYGGEVGEGEGEGGRAREGGCVRRENYVCPLAIKMGIRHGLITVGTTAPSQSPLCCDHTPVALFCECYYKSY